MVNFLELKDASCKDCYKCLRECPVKAIEYIDQKARIIEDRCILCGKCTHACPQNAKFVHSEIAEVLSLIASPQKVIASVAPSFISSFGVDNFHVMRKALKMIGFDDAEETAIGAEAVTTKYQEILNQGTYDNFITSCCPAVNTMIELYYHKALPYLAMVDSPMVAHAKIIKADDPNTKVVFIGPCIAKKREAYESKVVENALTFEDLDELLKARNIDLKTLDYTIDEELKANKARFYPISRGIIKSFAKGYSDKYEYLAVDGVDKCMQVLENIESYHGMFLELNACEYACVNGPCALINPANSIIANAEIRKYVNSTNDGEESKPRTDVEISKLHAKKDDSSHVVSEKEIQNILLKTGKKTKEDELDCGACGYSTCREKAWAVANGYAELEMCLPYMRKRAESMNYEIIKNSPNGIIVVDYDYKVQDMNAKAKEFLGVKDYDIKGKDLVTYTDPSPMIQAVMTGKSLTKDKVKFDKTGTYAEMSVTLMPEHKTMFCILRDITNAVIADDKIFKLKMETLQTTDEVIKKQMRVAQEIASLLGETTAESKVALLKLKKTLAETDDEVR